MPTMSDKKGPCPANNGKVSNRWLSDAMAKTCRIRTSVDVLRLLHEFQGFLRTGGRRAKSRQVVQADGHIRVILSHIGNPDCKGLPIERLSLSVFAHPVIQGTEVEKAKGHIWMLVTQGRLPYFECLLEKRFGFRVSAHFLIDHSQVLHCKGHIRVLFAEAGALDIQRPFIGLQSRLELSPSSSRDRQIVQP